MNPNPEPENNGKFNIISPPRVIVKFKEGKVPPYEGDIGDYIQKNNIGPWADLSQQFPGISINIIFVSVDPDTIANLVRQAQEMDPSYRDPNFLSYFAVEYDKAPDDASYDDLFKNMQNIQKELSDWANVELAYIDPGLGPLPSVPSNTQNDELDNQKYLDLASVGGVGVKFAWDYCDTHYPAGSGKGSGIKFIDVERGWDFAHVDLSDPTMPIPLTGIDKESRVHGTSSVGLVVGRDDATGDRGIVGIAYQATAQVVSVYPTTATGNPDRHNAVMTALSNLKYGDVLLIEEQAVGDAVTIGSVACHQLWPIETAVQTNPTTGFTVLIWEVIYMGTTGGIIIVEPAGNGVTPDLSTDKIPEGTSGNDLYSFTDSSGKHTFDRDPNSPTYGDFKDSQAIIVGAATRGEAAESYKHYRTKKTSLPSALPTNYGKRIDCYGWGEEVRTSGAGTDTALDSSGYNDFNGTSSAAAMIAGMVVLIQSIAVQEHGLRLGPMEMRSILSNPAYGTEVYSGVLPNLNALEGYMPDLQKILNLYFAVGF